MLKIPYKWQVLSLPVVLIVPIIGVILLTHSYLTEISYQNDTVKEWARATDQLTLAMAASQRMHSLLEKMQDNKTANLDEVRFSYVEQSLFLKSALKSPDLKDKIDAEASRVFSDTLKATEFNEQLDIGAAILAIQTLQHKIDTDYSLLQGKKREIYLTSNAYIQKSTDKLATLLSTVLGITLVIGLAVSVWLVRNTHTQLNNITRSAIRLLDKDPVDQSSAEYNKGDFGQVLNYFEQLKHRLLETAANSKLLEGTERERQRIAMDIHDQFLAEFTALRREIRANQNSEDMQRLVRQIDHTLERLTVELREIIDDLHPQALNMLGLEAAIQNYVSRKFSGDTVPEYYISIESGIENRLTSVQLIHLYRLMTEAINNIIFHASSSRYEVVLRLLDSGILLTIEDNGIGFNLESAMRKGGHGLINIHQRVKAIDASIDWQASRFSQGTCLKVHIANKYLLTDTNHSMSA